VLNRKMFKPRNARNALNRAAGIMPVQKFHAGGPVGHTHQGNMFQRFMNAPNSFSGVLNALRGNTNTNTSTSPRPLIPFNRNRKPPISMSEIEAAAIREASRPQTTGQRISGLLDSDKGISGAVGRAVGPDSSKLGIRSLQEIAKGTGQLVDLAGTATAAALSPFVSSQNIGAGTKPGPEVLTPGVIDSLNKGDKPFPDDLLGVDLMTLPGFQSGSKPPPLPAGTAPDISVKIGLPGSKSKPRPETPTEMMERIAIADAAMKTDMDPSSSAPVDPNEKPDELAFTQGTSGLLGEDQKKEDSTEDQKRILTEQSRMQQGQKGNIVPQSAEEIEKIINEGTPEQQEASLKQLMNEFTQNAPQYEGLDKGLALAKIGFAMAAGKSPNALENIANAFEKGADMFIKDKAKRDEFNRQVQLSALQYGLGEVGKQKAEQRLISRERRGTKAYTFGEEGGTYRGRKYGAFEDVEVTVADIQDNKMPSGLVSSAMVTALGARAKANAAIAKSQFEAGQISMSELSKQQETYTTAVDNVIKSEQAVDLLEDVMVDVAKGNVTGFKAGAMDFFNKVGNFAGFDFGKKYETKDQARSAMRQALQLMIPNTVGSTQSANSISNRDVDFLITAYFGEGAIDGGAFTFVTQDKDTMLKRLQGAALQMRNAQKKDFAQMQLVETNLMSVYQPGTQVSAIGSLSPARGRLSEAGLLPGQLSIGTTIGVTKGDDGVLRFN
tara:strand:- start:159 stop:2327 length:2169 start_codon:yes stop_codon:yes gene_type:complete